MSNSSSNRDLEVLVISEQFHVLRRKVSDLVDDIDSTISLFDEFRKKRQTFGEETEKEVNRYE